jgi:hypothetical protein
MLKQHGFRQAVKFMLDYMYQTDASVSPTPRGLGTMMSTGDL